MSTQFISSASAGDQQGFGTQLVENVAQGLLAVGIAALSIGHPLASDDSPARNIALDFQTTSEWGGRLDFDPTSRPFVPGGWYSFESGELTIENDAQGLLGAGWQSTQLGQSRFSGDYLARNVAFDFTQLQSAELAIHFNFAGANVLAASGWSSLQFGPLEIEAPAFASPQGWQSSRVGQSRFSGDYLARNIAFDFTQVQQAVLAQHFNFGGASVLVAGAWDSLGFGTHSVENDAQGLFGAGWQSAQLGQSRFSGDYLARNIELDFTVVSNPSLPIQLVFGGNNRTARFDAGLDATLYGDQYIWAVPFIEPAGWDSAEYGTDTNTIWLPYPIGFDSFTAGRNGIHFPGYVLPHDWDSSEFGLPDVPEIVFSGIRSTGWGQAEITRTEAPVTQDVVVEEGFDSAAFGPDEPSEDEAWVFAVSNYWRVLPDVGNVLLAAFSSEVLIGHSPQFVFTPFSNGMLEMGEPPRVGREIEIEMAPVPALSRFGTAIIDHARIYPNAFDSLTLHKPAIHNTARALVFDGIRGKLGTPQLAFNQFVDVFYDCGLLRDRCGSVFGEYTWVRNRNQTIRPNPLNSFRAAYFPYHIGLRGKGYQMQGFVSHEFNQRWEPMHLIDFRIRYYTVGGLNSFQSSSWHRVKNAARVLAPEGVLSVGLGLPDAERMLQRVHMWGTSSLQAPRVQRVSDGLQTTHVEHSIREENHGTPFVAYGARYVEVDGIDSFIWVRPVVWERPPQTLTPTWRQLALQDRAQMGRAQIENFNPQAFVYGKDMLATPQKAFWISFYERSLVVDSIEYGAVFGRPRIEDADKFYDFQGFELSKFSQNATVWLDPPTTYLPIAQALHPDGWNSFEAGDWQLLESAIHVEGFDSFRGGDTFIYANGILFDSRHSPQHGWAEFGRAQLFGGEDVLEVDEYDDDARPSGQGTAYGKPRISPHTIWCRNDTPQQAKQNHPGRSWCDVDKFCRSASHPFHGIGKSKGSAKEGPWFGWGTQVFMAATQWPSISGNYSFVAGTPELTFGTNIFGPESIHFFRTGFATVVTNETKFVKFRSGIDAWEAGEPPFAVTDNGPRYANVHGLGSLQFSDSHAENLHRFIYPVGAEMTLYEPMSYYPYPAAPVIYHHPRGPSEVVGQEFTEFGFATDDLHVSHSPRWLYTVGNIMLKTNWTVFREWLRIYNLDTIAFSFAFNDMLEPGQAHVQASVARIGPYGINPVCASPGFEVTHGVV